MAEVMAYHVVFCTHGFGCRTIRGARSRPMFAEQTLRAFGSATPTAERRTVAGVPHNEALRLAAKRALVRPEVVFDGHQALSVARGFAEMRSSGCFARQRHGVSCKTGATRSHLNRSASG